MGHALKHGKHRRRVSILYNIRMYDLRVCMYICIQIWTHFHCDSGWKIPTCIEVANASVHQDLALRWARRRRRQSTKEKTNPWKTRVCQHFRQVAGPGLLQQFGPDRYGQRNRVHAEVPSAFALPRSIGQAGFTIHRPSPTYSNF